MVVVVGACCSARAVLPSLFCVFCLRFAGGGGGFSKAAVINERTLLSDALICIAIRHLEVVLHMFFFFFFLWLQFHLVTKCALDLVQATQHGPAPQT